MPFATASGSDKGEEQAHPSDGTCVVKQNERPMRSTFEARNLVDCDSGRSERDATAGGPATAVSQHGGEMSASEKAGPPACVFDSDKLTVALDLLVPSATEAISPVVSKLMRLLKGTSCAAEHAFAVETALREALANAIVHGNRLDRGKKVRICCACQKDRGVIIIVKDEGEGFDPTKVPSPLVGETIGSVHGRGIYLVNMLMDEVHFECGGKEIHMRKEE